MIWIWLLRIPLLGDNAYLSALADVDAVTEEQKFRKNKKMPKIDTLDALDDEMTSILNTL